MDYKQLSEAVEKLKKEKAILEEKVQHLHSEEITILNGIASHRKAMVELEAKTKDIPKIHQAKIGEVEMINKEIKRLASQRDSLNGELTSIQQQIKKNLEDLSDVKKSIESSSKNIGEDKKRLTVQFEEVERKSIELEKSITLLSGREKEILKEGNKVNSLLRQYEKDQANILSQVKFLDDEKIKLADEKSEVAQLKRTYLEEVAKHKNLISEQLKAKEKWLIAVEELDVLKKSVKEKEYSLQNRINELDERERDVEIKELKLEKTLKSREKEIELATLRQSA